MEVISDTPTVSFLCYCGQELEMTRIRRETKRKQEDRSKKRK